MHTGLATLTTGMVTKGLHAHWPSNVDHGYGN